MTSSRTIAALFAMLLAAGGAAAQGNWASYRDTYRAMAVFEKYGRPKQLIEQRLQLAGRGQGDALVIDAPSGRRALALDATGRAVFPLSKAAYDENAALVASIPGPLALRARVSIVVRADGVYELEALRAACAQALQFEQHRDASARALRCVGVRLAFAPGAEPARLRTGAGDTLLPLADGPAFADEAGAGFRVATLRWDAAASGQLRTPNAPLAISPVFE